MSSPASCATHRASLLALGLCFAGVMPATKVAAYCTAHACNVDMPGGSACVRDVRTGCSIGGQALERPDGCVHFAVQRGRAESLLGLRDERLEQVITEAFEAWASVDCGDGHPSIEVSSLGMVDVDEPYACLSVPEQNVDTWLLSDELAGEDAITPTSGATAGTTRPAFYDDTGEVFDADVLLNELWFLVQDEENIEPYLRVVAMHEAGHSLGLAHSQDEDALMYREYRVTADRALTQDDIDGICALFPPAELQCESVELPRAAFERNACAAADVQEEEERMHRMGARPAAEESGCSVRGPVGSRRGGLAPLAILLCLGLWRARRYRGLLASAFAFLAACSSDQAARLATPNDPELETRVHELEKACELSAIGKLTCQSAADEELATEFLLGKRSRVAALPTLSHMLTAEDGTLRALAAQLLSIGFSIKLGDGLPLGAVDASVSAALLDALRTLPLDQARQITPAAVHAAMLSGQLEALQKAVATRGDAELQRMAYRRMMVHGRLRALPAIQAVALGPDSPLAAAAIEALRNMVDWTPAEQDALCPWALELYRHADPPRAARAAQALGNCTGAHVDALLAVGRALHAEGKLDSARLTAFMDVCKKPENVTSGGCATELAFLQSLVEDRASSTQLRLAAVAAIARQTIDDAPNGAPSPDPELLPRLMASCRNDPSPEVAKYCSRMREHLELTRAATTAPTSPR